MHATNEEITAVYLYDKFRPVENDNDFCIGRAELSNGPNGSALLDDFEFSVLGHWPRGESFDGTLDGKPTRPPSESLTPEIEYRLYGHWEDNEKFGRQFRLKSFSVAKQASQSGVCTYLQQANGIGPATAKRLWEAFGPDALAIVKDEPARAAASGKFPLAKAETAAEFFRKESKFEAVKMELMDLLDGRGFPKAAPAMLIEKHGLRAAEIVKNQTFRCMELRGVGFLKCNSLYLHLDHPPGGDEQRAWALWHVLDSDRSGSPWLSRAIVERELQSLVDIQPGDLERLIRLSEPSTFREAFGYSWPNEQVATMRDCLVCKGAGSVQRPDLFTGRTMEDCECDDCGGDGGRMWVADGRKAATEDFLVNEVRSRRQSTAYWPAIDGPNFAELSESQRQALADATDHGGIGVLCGYAGTGKTTSLAALVKTVIDQHGPSEIAICAPTGKAAVRCMEAMAEKDIFVSATTAHRLLGVRTSGAGDWTFVHNHRNPLRHRFVVVDEGSMMGAGIMANLLNALSPDANLLIVGDIEQLPPVDHGAPMRDMMGLVPTGKLEEIWRNAGGIVKACEAVRLGQPIEFDGNIEHIAAKGAAAGDAIVSLIDEVRNGGLFDPKWDVQVCVALNDKSPLSRKSLNERLQAVLNPEGERVANSSLRIGDKVICQKNQSLKLVDGKPPTNSRNAAPLPGCFQLLRLQWPFDAAAAKKAYLSLSLKAHPDQGGTVQAFRQLKDAFDESILRLAEGWTPEREQACRDAPKDKGETLVCNGEFGEVIGVDGKRLIVEFTLPKRKVYVPFGEGGGRDIELGYACTVWKMQGSGFPVAITVVDDAPGASGHYGNCDRAYLYTGISRAEKQCYVVGRSEDISRISLRSFLERRKTFLRQKVKGEL